MRFGCMALWERLLKSPHALNRVGNLDSSPDDSRGQAATRPWYQSRPRWFALALFYAAYVLTGGLGQGLALIPGVAITFWPPAGVFLATLLLNPRSSWPWYVGAGCLAELTCNAIWFHNPGHLALVYFGANVLEALTAAGLIRRFVGNTFRLDSVTGVMALVVLGAIVAPVVGATLISITDALLAKHPFTTAWPLVWLGDGTGLLVSTPLTFVVVQAWRERAGISLPRAVEAAVLLLVLLVICALAFKGILPTAYMALPVLLWAAVRFQLSGAAAAVALTTLMSAVFTWTGAGEFAGGAAMQHDRIVMLQAFLGISAISALLVAALSQQHLQALLKLKSANSDLEARVEARTADLQEREGQLRLFIDNAPAAIAMFDRDMRYLAASRRWKSDYGLGDTDLVARSHYDVLPEIAGAWRTAHLRGLGGEALASDGERFDAKDGSTRWFKWEIFPWRTASGGIGGILITTEDITARKLAEERLRDADRRKDEFIATLAHELRNPLAPIRNAVQVLKEPEGATQLSWARSVIERQVTQMARLLDDLLDVSRISRNRVELRIRRVTLASVLDGAIETSRPLIEAGRHQLTVNLPPQAIWLDIDPVRLAQVFTNLLNNAAKYTKPGGHIVVTAQAAGGEAVIAVRDDGIGIAPEMLPRIFEMFLQTTPALERSQGGLGIGLALSKGLVEAMGGRIEVRSDGAGRGSEFLVHLPRAVETAGEDTAHLSQKEHRHLEPRRVLIADDLKDSADSLALLLKMAGHEVHTAYDGAQALAAADAMQPDLVVLDLGMPKLNGYDVCREIRKRDWGRHTCIVALSGWGQDEDRRRTLAAGFDHHLVKPVEMSALLSIIASTSRNRIDQRAGPDDGQLHRS
jgi:PAS domain S-box-containing protein